MVGSGSNMVGWYITNPIDVYYILLLDDDNDLVLFDFIIEVLKNKLIKL